MDGLHIVVAQPPSGVSDADFNHWYDAHLDEILSVKGFRSAQRFQLEPVVGGDVLPHRFICVYEIDGDPREAVAELERAGMGSADSYGDMKDDDEGELPLPGWWDGVRFASWNLLPLGERRGPRA
ncbi:hypothetical protein [Solirubrobacter soli]|uniref:hypothetical protein n=1 Tax=Solirubrobacter soli TaxID=363832 RepID=UPI0004024163|nr:hypothetical protein [Solirubrobacter soli]